jgi:hypothetical protein
MTPATVLGWLRANGHAPEPRGGQVYVPRWPYVPEAMQALVLEHREAIRALLLAPEPAPEPEEQEPTAAGAPEPEPPPPAAITPEPPRVVPSLAAPVALPREKWDACGVWVLNGTPTHALGDQHAARIISGEIPYEQAVGAREATVSMLEDMALYARLNR